MPTQCLTKPSNASRSVSSTTPSSSIKQNSCLLVIRLRNPAHIGERQTATVCLVGCQSGVKYPEQQGQRLPSKFSDFPTLKETSLRPLSLRRRQLPLYDFWQEGIQTFKVKRGIKCKTSTISTARGSLGVCCFCCRRCCRCCCCSKCPQPTHCKKNRMLYHVPTFESDSGGQLNNSHQIGLPLG